MAPVFFDGWGGLFRILIVAPAIYAFVVLCVRIAGKRSTSQMNSFDWIVTVAIGGILASTTLLEGVVLLEGAFAIALLFGLQWGVTKGAVRSENFASIVKAAPALLLVDGEFRREALESERVSEQEVLAAIRESGLPDRHGAAAVVLETDANLSVVPRSAAIRSGSVVLEED